MRVGGWCAAAVTKPQCGDCMVMFVFGRCLQWCEFADIQCLTRCGVVLFTIASRSSLVCADLHLQSGMRCYSCASATVLGVAAMAGRGMTTAAGGPASLAPLLAIAADESDRCEWIVRTSFSTSQMWESLSFWGFQIQMVLYMWVLPYDGML